jgi:PAS domain S-box-containing protein
VVELLGYTASDVIGHSLTEFLAKNQYANPSGISLEEALQKQQPFSYLQGTFLTRDAKIKYLEVSGLPYYTSKRKLGGFHGSIRDVTHRVESERSIRQSLAEKETLIKEIHHRVKNNLQIVTSLLHLQTQFIQDPDMLARLQESQDRIHTMALVHEKIYQSKDLSRIDFKDYLEALTRHISNSYRNPLIKLSQSLPAEDVYVGIDTAVPCGLIVNEVLTNAYKHAFKPGSAGSVELVLAVTDDTATLTIADSGKGLPNTDIQAYQSASLGMQLVDALVHQLRGRLDVQNAPGARFVLSFKL